MCYRCSRIRQVRAVVERQVPRTLQLHLLTEVWLCVRRQASCIWATFACIPSAIVWLGFIECWVTTWCILLVGTPLDCPPKMRRLSAASLPVRTLD